MSKLLGQSKDIVHIHKYKPSEMQRAKAELVAQIDSLMQNKDLGSPSTTLTFQTRVDPVLVRDRVHKFHQLETMAKPPRSKLLAEGQGGSWMLFCCCHWCWKHPLLSLCGPVFVNCNIYRTHICLDTTFSFLHVSYILNVKYFGRKLVWKYSWWRWFSSWFHSTTADDQVLSKVNKKFTKHMGMWPSHSVLY